MLPTAELSSSRVGECASLASQEDAFLASQLGAGAPWEVTVRPGSGPDVVTYDVSPQDPAAEARMKVACITEQVLTLVNKRLGLYRHFDETVNRYKQSRDVSTLNSGKKSLETEHKALTSGLALLQSRLKTEGSDLCDKVSEMQRLDAQVKELVLKAAVEAERLVAGKLKKDTYIENEKLISGKRQELVGKIDHILDAL